jgi:hypothetical protein
MPKGRIWKQEYQVGGDRLGLTLKDLIREGRARRIIVKNSRGRTLLKLPLWLGALSLLDNGSLLALTAYGAVTDRFTIVVERAEEQ